MSRLRDITPWHRRIGVTVLAPDGAPAEVWGRSFPPPTKRGERPVEVWHLWRAGRLLPPVPAHEARDLPIIATRAETIAGPA